MNEVNSAPILPARLDWPSAIGNFLMNFGALHYLVIEHLNTSLEASEFARYKERPFKDQIMRIAQHLQQNPSAIEKQREFQLLLNRLDAVRTLRNHIAHGHMLCRLDPASGSWVVSITLPKDLDVPYVAETVHLTFDELRTRLDELRELIEAFKRFAGITS